MRTWQITGALSGISVRRQRYNRAVTSVVEGVFAPLQQHWLAIFNSILGLFIGLSALGPVLYALGLNAPASGLFDFYRLLCGQVPSHSFYISGYQMCLCSRCLAIYSSLLAGGLVLAMFRYRRLFAIRPISWKMWALAMLPMALDGGTQLFGWHESNVYLRLLTGIIFGLATAWYVLPQIEGTPNRPALAGQAFVAPTQEG
ncbi:MAG: DUF2085 domain-containing protein [Ktedonobacterales bacterium]